MDTLASMHMNFSEHTEGGLPRVLKRLFFTFPFYQRCRRRSNIPLFSHQSALPTRKESIPPRERQPNIACFIFWLGSLIPLIATKIHLQYLPHLVLLPVQRRFRTSGTTLPTESRCAKFTSYSLRNYTQGYPIVRIVCIQQYSCTTINQQAFPLKQLWWQLLSRNPCLTYTS